MRFLIHVLCLLTLSQIAYSQHPYSQIWALGNAGTFETGTRLIFLDFKNGQEMEIDISPVRNLLQFSETNAMICDSSGRLVLYTNGNRIADSSHQIIHRGDTLADVFSYHNSPFFGSIYWQSAMILPYPDRDQSYMVFYGANDLWPVEDIHMLISPRIYYAEVNYRNDRWEVTTKQNLLHGDIMNAYIHSIRHDNNRDWWILTQDPNSVKNYVFLLDSAGIHHIHTEEFRELNEERMYFGSTGAASSPDGRLFARFTPTEGLEVMDFDRVTGILSNYRHFATPEYEFWRWGSVAFSPGGRFLYFSDPSQLYQVDLHSGDWSASMVLIDTFDGYVHNNLWATSFYELRPTPDCRIFLSAKPSTPYIHVIMEPDKPGKACRFVQRAIELPGLHYGGLPNYPNFNLGTAWESYCDSILTSAPAIHRDKMSIDIWPNPSGDWLYVKSDQTLNDFTLQVFNLQGIPMREVQIESNDGQIIEMSLSGIPMGMYILHVTKPDQTIHQLKFLKL